MPRWEEYKAEARERGALALELFVAQSIPAAPPEELKATLPAHLEYQSALEAQGKLAFAGPLSDETGEELQGMGMIIYRAASFDEARQLAEADPMHETGKRTFILRKWLINEGSLSIDLKLSAQTVAVT